MSVSVGVYVAVAMFLAVGGDTEEAMREEMQTEAAGVAIAEELPPCEPVKATNTPYPCAALGFPCLNLTASGMLCALKPVWNPAIPEVQVEELLRPEWVPADQPDQMGRWLKLQL